MPAPAGPIAPVRPLTSRRYTIENGTSWSCAEGCSRLVRDDVRGVVESSRVPSRMAVEVARCRSARPDHGDGRCRDYHGGGDRQPGDVAVRRDLDLTHVSRACDGVRGDPRMELAPVRLRDLA